MMKKILTLFYQLNYRISHRVILIYSKVRFPDVWALKEYLFRYEKRNRYYYKLNSAYNCRIAQMGGGSWIGCEGKFENKPFFPHGMVSVFISNGVSIGKNCIIFQQVTIGSNTIKDHPKFGAPTIGDNVFIGAGAKIIGNIRVGNNCRIGANAVVAKDIPDNSVVIPSMQTITKEQVLDNRFYSKRNDRWGYYDFNSQTFIFE